MQEELFGDIERKAKPRALRKRDSRERSLKHYHKHKSEMCAKKRAYRKANPDKCRRQSREYNLRLKLEGIAAYGGKCACRGESRVQFMTLDHINGREPGDRFTGAGSWRLLKALGWPMDNYQLLCFNCNCAKGYFGQCPHEAERESCQ
jgi:hypothetical protein